MMRYDHRSGCFIGEQSIIEPEQVLGTLQRLVAAGVPSEEALRRVLDERTWERTLLVATYRVVAQAAVAEAERIISAR
jgi:hypothetical protein